MELVERLVRHIIPGCILVISLGGCAVQKTPYFKKGYYQSSVSRLDSLKPEISIASDSLYAGFSKVSITPDIGRTEKQNRIPIAGFGQRKTKYATGIHDSVFIKTVALKVGEQTVFIVGADLLLMPENITDSVISDLSKAGIPRNSLFFSATHTHSSIGGWGQGVLAKLIAGRENPDIEKWLTERIVRSVLDAKADLCNAKLGMSNFNGANFIRNRLTGDPRQINPDFNYYIVEQTGRKKTIIGSFSAHPTTIGRKNTLISGDYPGFWQRKMENSGFDMAVFCGGSMGGQSPVGKGEEYENAKYIGEALADTLLLHLKEVTSSDRLILSSLSLKISLPKYKMRLTKNLNLTSGLSRKVMPLPQNVYLQALQINNMVWFFTPGDFSGELALTVSKLLAGKGYKAMVTGYNGSYVGYIIPGKYFYLDHYESRSMTWFGPYLGDYHLELIERMGDVIISQEAKE